METPFNIERSRAILNDGCKWTLIPSKIILESLSLWPEVQTWAARILSTLYLLNIAFMLTTHTAYFIENIRDIVKMAELLTTVNISLQSFVRISTLLYYKNDLRILLGHIWNDFLLTDVLNPEAGIKLKKMSIRYFSAVMMFGIAATCTTVQFMYQPLVLGIRSLPLQLKLPFSYDESPMFELLYVWNCFTCMSIQFSVLGFDFFFTMLVWNAAMQFKILRILLSNIVAVDNSSAYLTGAEDREATEREREESLKLVKYIAHHDNLLDICDSMESMFKYILLIQLFDSALALCVCSFAAATVPSLFAKMMTFSMMYLMQLFLYCAFGNELLHQSTTLAYAAFRCGWHYSENKFIRTSIIRLMQRSQKGQCLTARGFATLNYRSCGQVIRMAFSFYTLLDAVKNKK